MNGLPIYQAGSAEAGTAGGHGASERGMLKGCTAMCPTLPVRNGSSGAATDPACSFFGCLFLFLLDPPSCPLM